SGWGLQKGYSFDGPVWSVSIELLAYAIFFIFCRKFNLTFISLLLVIFVGDSIHRISAAYGLDDTIPFGIRDFFIGGLVFMAYEKLIDTGDRWKVSFWLPFAASIAWLTTIVVVNPNVNFAFGGGHLPMIAHKMVSAWPSFVLFPMTIMSLALIETKLVTFGKRLSFIGDISYSSYLLHFPLQLTVATVVATLSVNEALFYSPLFMASFFFVLIVLSLVSHRYFEVPMQRFLRRKAAQSVTQKTTIARVGGSRSGRRPM
ncbi:MAG: acyltransferase, partial [Methylocella sp.]